MHVQFSASVCCEKAFKIQPSNLVYLISEIPHWISVSSLSGDEYKHIYVTINNGNEHYDKFVMRDVIRWFVQGKYIQIIIHQWEDLKAYLRSIIDRNNNARIIKEKFFDDVQKLYFTFACPKTQNFESLNAALQASLLPNKLFHDLKELRNILLQKSTRIFLRENYSGACVEGVVSGGFNVWRV